LRKQIWLENLQEADGLRDVEVARRVTSKLIKNSGLQYGLGLSGAW